MRMHFETHAKARHRHIHTYPDHHNYALCIKILFYYSYAACVHVHVVNYKRKIYEVGGFKISTHSHVCACIKSNFKY